ncbi:MAG: hypothetical protein RLY16_1362, partial [Bacteroidota bacterium]
NNGEAYLTRTVICFGKTEALSIPLGGYRRTGTNVVFGNQSWDAQHYVENILKPALNLFYQKNAINLFFDPVLPVIPQNRFFQILNGLLRRFENTWNHFRKK